ncbi:T9SS type A sorting domain-containing protein [Flavobacterium psychrophilum]|uniref:T9SS type A sorting domain-containing protein n=1 Tax=Flavobacterium psychrophilum TaxID=96345 RepID=UPI000B7C0D8B|nr:T9SS type A sorting domain-containing protein [Flavobacterium psychrophilum]SNB00704.1 conserved exported hypothetical protein [Flavobacterium psychrophilum]
MKKQLFQCVFAFLLICNASYCQIKSSGTVILDPGVMSVKFDLNQATSIVTLTLTGPSNKWFAIGFNADEMDPNTDMVSMKSSTVLGDERLVVGGHHDDPVADAVNNWTLTSNIITGSTRTIVATRAFVAENTDYTFAYSRNSLKIIWAYAKKTTYGYDNKHHGDNYDFKLINFTTLGEENYNYSNEINIFPNPSDGIFNISKKTEVNIDTIRVFDINAKLIRTISLKNNHFTNAINLEDLTSGKYFLELSNDSEKTVKTVIIN